MNLSPHSQQTKLRHQNDTRTLDFHRHLQVEVTIKLIFSWVLALGAIVALVKLVPYHFSQQAKLREIDAQVEETRGRVDRLKEELNRNFDSQQSQNLMEEYSPRLAPHQSIIFWLDREQNQKDR